MDNRRQSGGSSLNTFFLGVLVGVFLTLLFTTKKGRKLLKIVTDEGVDRLSHWESVLKSIEKEIEDDAFDEESVLGEDVREDVRMLHAPKKEEMHDDKDLSRSEKKEDDTPKKSRRLFKGIRRKSSV